MKSACKKLILTFLTFVALFALQRGVFVAIYSHLEPQASASQWLGAFLHGLPLDLSMGGYLTIIPAILIIFGMTSWSAKTLWPERVYYGLAALLLGVVFVLDIVLYSYWGQRLDYTPIFYFSTSPSAALASAGFFQALGGDPSPFTFSKDFFNPASPHFALFTARDAFGYVDAADTAVYNIDASRVTFSGGPGANEAAEKAKASLQHIYHTISRL